MDATSELQQAVVDTRMAQSIGSAPSDDLLRKRTAIACAMTHLRAALDETDRTLDGGRDTSQDCRHGHVGRFCSVCRFDYEEEGD
jgi:hypothetical protein